MGYVCNFTLITYVFLAYFEIGKSIQFSYSSKLY